jgi:hypothetical protein
MTTEIAAAGVKPAVLVVRPGPGQERVTAVPAPRPAPPREPERTGPPATPSTTLCRCGHDAQAHEHYRPGSDCGACGAAACARFRAQGRRW